jgi:hypothetical protein
MTIDREQLVRLYERLETERGRILADQRTLEECERLPAQLIRDLADIEGAARAVATEIARHTPQVGYGAET